MKTASAAAFASQLAPKYSPLKAMQPWLSKEKFQKALLTPLPKPRQTALREPSRKPKLSLTAKAKNLFKIPLLLILK